MLLQIALFYSLLGLSNILLYMCTTNLNLKSEASIRYGKGLNYEYTENAINRACHLLEKYANAKILSGTVCFDNIDKTDEKKD